MTIETKPFDVAEVLNSDERISAYLEEAFESGDPSVIASAIGDVARSRNLSTLARNAGLTRETIYQAFSPDGNPTLSTMTAMMKSLGFRLSFERIDRAAG
jgi:probable addiction module antidote protein